MALQSPRGAVSSPGVNAASPRVDQQFDSHGGYALKQEVYFQHPHESWIRGTISEIKAVSKKGGFAEVCFGVVPLLDPITLSNMTTATPQFPLRDDQVHAIVADAAGGGGSGGGDAEESDERIALAGDTVNDLLQLSYLHDSTLLEQVRKRYFRKLIYTHIGPIMLALNPYDFTLKHYVDANLPKYMEEGDAVVTKPSKHLPHAWTTAHYSYWLMSTDREHQSVIVSGESGAGKTETAKIVVKYLGNVSTAQCSEDMRASAQAVTVRVNLTSPILEAFGNAKTRMNDNSSRFGKFMKVHFTPQNGGGGGGAVMVGAAIEVYLLEKSRIVTHGEGERAYHCFYQLLADGSNSNGSNKPLDADAQRRKNALKDRIQLDAATTVPSLSIGNATVIGGVDDAQDFEDVVSAMRAVGLDDDERSAVWSIVGAILHLLQVNFTAVTDDECSVDATSKKQMTLIQELLGVDVAKLQAELITTTNITRGETIVKKLRKALAMDLRDALGKCLYESLFLWLVAKINDLIRSPDSVDRTKTLWIALLDIFGFENFAHGNSFEQMCINLANETLQNHYNSIIFTRDMNECEAEGINTESVTFYDNQPCLDLLCGLNFSQCGFPGSSGTAQVTNKLSIMGLIDESCSLASGSDLALCATIVEKYGGKPSDGSGSHPNFSKPKTQNNAFIIAHYAGEVKYTIDAFRAKNADTLKETLKDVIRDSSNGFVAGLLAPPPASPTSGGGGGGQPSRRTTVGTFFKNQLVSLMTEINATHPHWVRCIKPHSAKKPNMFHGVEVMTQLRSAGVLETVRIRQQSYSVRLPFQEFVARFRNLLRAQTSAAANAIVFDILGRSEERVAYADNTPAAHVAQLQSASSMLSSATGGGAADDYALSRACTAILSRSGILQHELAQVGRTKVFLRTKAFHLLAQVMRVVKATLLTSIQAYAQGYMSCKRARCLVLNQKLKFITAFLVVRPSQREVRLLELRAKEHELLTTFRHLMLLQRDEVTARATLNDRCDAALAVVVQEEADALVLLRAEWERRKVLADHKARDAAVAEACRCSESVAQEEVNTRAILRSLFTLDWDEEQGRTSVSAEEATVRIERLVPVHANVLCALQAYLGAVFVAKVDGMMADETVQRRAVCDAEAAAFQTLRPIMALAFQEAKGRNLLLHREAEYMAEFPAMVAKAAADLRSNWENRKAHRDRYTQLVLQREEQAARVQIEDDWEQELILVLEDVNEYEAQARNNQYEREAQEERARLAVVIQERELMAAEEQRQFMVMRRAAQDVWQQAKDEMDMINAIKAEEAAICQLRTAQAGLTRSFMEECRRREISKRPANSSRSRSTTAFATSAAVTQSAEHIRQQQLLLGHQIAAHEDRLALLQSSASMPRQPSVHAHPSHSVNRSLGASKSASPQAPSGSPSPVRGQHGTGSLADLVDDCNNDEHSICGDRSVSKLRTPSRSEPQPQQHTTRILRQQSVHSGGSMDMIERLSVLRCCASSSNYASNPEHRLVARGEFELVPEVADPSVQARKLDAFHASKRRRQQEYLQQLEEAGAAAAAVGGPTPSFVVAAHRPMPTTPPHPHRLPVDDVDGAAGAREGIALPSSAVAAGPLSHMAHLRSVAASGNRDDGDAGDEEFHPLPRLRSTAYCSPKVHCGIAVHWPPKTKAQVVFPKVSKNPFSDAWRPVFSSTDGGTGMYSYLPDGTLVPLPAHLRPHVGAAADDGSTQVIDLDATELHMDRELDSGERNGVASSPRPTDPEAVDAEAML